MSVWGKDDVSRTNVAWRRKDFAGTPVYPRIAGTRTSTRDASKLPAGLGLEPSESSFVLS